MREPKKLKNSPTAGATNNASDNGLPIASPLNNRQPKTPKQTDTSGPDTPRSVTSDQWPPPSQTASSQARALKALSAAESTEMPPPTPELAGTPLSLRSPGGMVTIPSSPLDQFKKEDPMEKMAQMATSLGSAGGLLSMRSPSAAPSTPLSYIPASPGGQNRSRSAGLTLPGPPGPMSPHLLAGGGMSPIQQIQQQAPIINANHGMPPADQPYLPNQNYIYVFDTNLANDAAESVRQGLMQNLVQFHQGLKATQSFLSRCQVEGRPSWNLQPGQQQQQQQRPQMLQNASFMQQQGQSRPQMRPDFINSNNCGGPTPAQLQAKHVKMEKLRMMKEILSPENSQVAPPPPYGPPGVMPGMMPSRPTRPPNPSSGSQRGRRGVSQIENSTISLEEVNYQVQQQSMEMMIKAENNNCLSPGFPGVPADGAYGAGGPTGINVHGSMKDGTTSVMPVPSPQPIQYVNSQLDQEVVIQKQPNRNFMRGPLNGGPRGMQQMSAAGPGGPPRMRGPHPNNGMMPINMEHINQQFPDHMSGPRMTGPMMMSGPAGQNMNSVMSNHMQCQQQSQFQSQQHFSAQSSAYQGPGPGQSQQQQQQCMSDMSMQRHTHPGVNGACSASEQMLQAQQFEASMRAQFHGHPGGAAAAPGSLSHGPVMNSNQPQTVNNTYVNAKIAIEHVNIQNVPGYDNVGGGPQYQSHGGQASVNFSSDHLHGPSGGNVHHMGPASGMQALNGSTGYPSAPSFDGVHVRSNQPNTIQYLPNRPPPPKQTRPPLNLDFLQPWTGGGGGGQGQGQVSRMPAPPHMQSSGGFTHQQGPAGPMNIPTGQMMQYGPGGNNGEDYPSGGQMMVNADPQYAPGYQQFQQQLYASNVASSRHQQQHQPQPSSTQPAAAAPQQ